jgi:hypothetical protein
MTNVAHLTALTICILLATGTNSASQAARQEARVCNQAAAAALTGKNRISNHRAKRLTGATIVRQVRPGQGVTMDYRRERVTIETDRKTEKIVRASCG